MPTYVYRCQQCGATLERRQRFQDAPLTLCEQCGGELRRVLQPVGVIFKGSGFYSTDYRNSTAGKSEEAKESKPAIEPTTTPAHDSSDSGTTTKSTAPAAAPSSPSSGAGSSGT